MGMDKFTEMDQMKRLADFEAYTVFEVHSVERMESVHGEVAVMSYRGVRGDRREAGKMLTPIRFAPSEESGTKCPMVLVYFGKVEMKSGTGTCHQMEVAGCGGTVDESAQMATDLRKLSIEDLKDRVKVQMMSHFPHGTVFTYSKVRSVPSRFAQSEGKAAEDKAYIMSYETYVGNRHRQGEVFVPKRTYAEAKKSVPGVMVYRGDAVSKVGRKYYDLSVLGDLFKTGLLDDQQETGENGKTSDESQRL
jgi:hypothetical protein